MGHRDIHQRLPERPQDAPPHRLRLAASSRGWKCIRSHPSNWCARCRAAVRSLRCILRERCGSMAGDVMLRGRGVPHAFPAAGCAEEDAGGRKEWAPEAGA